MDLDEPAPQVCDLARQTEAAFTGRGLDLPAELRPLLCARALMITFRGPVRRPPPEFEFLTGKCD